MDITPRISENTAIIQNYGPRGFTVSNVAYDTSIALGRSSVAPITATRFEELTDTMIREAVIGMEGIEILLIGSGAAQAFLPPSRRQLLKAKGITIDCMDTGAACRTFNILQAEDRHVGAILIKL